MTTHSEADTYIAGLNPAMSKLAGLIHEEFAGKGCSSYVKTIYVGYDLGGEMVAAMYGHVDHVEVALALPEDAAGPLLVDARHLTWRTLPVAALVRSADDMSELTALVQTAIERVRSQAHEVSRDNDFFIRSRQERPSRFRRAADSE